MPAIQSLKKQLRGIKSTQKITKAMKTVATVKFSQLNAVYAQYTEYGEQCSSVYSRFGAAMSETVRIADENAPCAVIVMASNKGLCGSFNSELLNFAVEELEHIGECFLVACGKMAASYFKEKCMPVSEEYVFSDVPAYAESGKLLEDIIGWRIAGKVSRVFVIYPHYGNMMVQTPVIRELFCSEAEGDEDLTLLVPDRETVVARAAKPVLQAILHKLVLETAVGAQAATLMTMRSAYDTASEYCEQLEGEINRKRQSTVTADVLETAGEYEE